MEKQDIKIEYATLEDVSACHKIDEQDDFYDYGTWEESFKRAVERDELLIAQLGEEIVGYLRFGFIWDLELPFIEMLRVLPKSRKLGVGRKLVQELIRVCEEKEFSGLVSSTGENNKVSIEFHKRLGFKEIGKLQLIENDNEEVFFRYDLNKTK